MCAESVCAGVPFCDDSNPCTDDSCDVGGCINAPNTDACNDGDACTKGDVCSDKTCGGKALDCKDAFECTTDGCDTQTGCTFETDSSKCNDTFECTTDVCTADKGCQAVNDDGKECDDGSKCTVGDLCAGGDCEGEAVNCSDDLPCTKDGCDPEVGCVYPLAPTCPVGGFSVATFSEPSEAVVHGGSAVVESGGLTLIDTGQGALGVLWSTEPVATQSGLNASFVVSGGSVPTFVGRLAFTFQKVGSDLIYDDPTQFSNTVRVAFSDTAAAGQVEVWVGTTSIVSASMPAGWLLGSEASLEISYTPGDLNVLWNGSAVLSNVTLDLQTTGVLLPDSTTFVGVVGGDLEPFNGKVSLHSLSVAVAADCTPTLCNDEEACTDDDVCTDGVCIGTPKVCDDGIPCTADSCNEGPGCTFAPDDGACPEGAGCTKAVCDPDTGCETPPDVGALCDDDDPCTVFEKCDAQAQCASGAVLCNGELPVCSTVDQSCYSCDQLVSDIEGYSANEVVPASGVCDTLLGFVAGQPAFSGQTFLCSDGQNNEQSYRYVGGSNLDTVDLIITFPDEITHVEFDYRSFLGWSSGNTQVAQAPITVLNTNPPSVLVKQPPIEQLQHASFDFDPPVTWIGFRFEGEVKELEASIGIDNIEWTPVQCPPEPN